MYALPIDVNMYSVYVCTLMVYTQAALEDKEDTAMDVDLVTDQDSHQLHKTEYEVIAFIKKKLTFTDRPNPIVQKASSKK